MSIIADQIELLKLQNKVIKPKVLAEILGLTPEALAKQRSRKKGPPYLRVSGCGPIYDRDEVVEFLERYQRREPSHGPDLDAAP